MPGEPRVLVLTLSGGEKLRRIGKALEFERIAGRVMQEHRGLLADFALEPYLRRYQELAVCLLQLVSECLPVVHVENYTEMSRRHLVAINGIGIDADVLIVDEMYSNLMTEEVEVNPALISAPFRTAEHTAIEGVSSRKVRHGNREVKWTERTSVSHRRPPLAD